MIHALDAALMLFRKLRVSGEPALERSRILLRGDALLVPPWEIREWRLLKTLWPRQWQLAGQDCQCYPHRDFAEMDSSLVDPLRQHLDFLETSCRLYDEGHVNEAVRIAVTLRVLFHSSKNQTSLIRQMGTENIELLSTCPKYKRPSASPVQVGKNKFKAERDIWPGIVRIASEIGVTEWMYCAPLDAHRVEKWMRFGYWWQEVICAFPGVRDITRAVIVTAVANKAGAHVDLKLPDEYRAMILSPNLANLVEDDGKWVVKPLRDYHLPALRQIGYEVLKSPSVADLCKRTFH